jgi:hypothetical protein
MGRFATSLTLKVPTEKLLTKLKHNRSLHEGNYFKALEAFKIDATKALLDRGNSIKNDPVGEARDYSKTFHFNIPIPVSYVSAYDEVIEMLEFSEQQEVEISGDQYRAWVEDKWDWSHTFENSTMWYNK